MAFKIEKRGLFWALLEGKFGVDAFPTKKEAEQEKIYRELSAANQLKQMKHADQLAEIRRKFLGN